MCPQLQPLPVHGAPSAHTAVRGRGTAESQSRVQDRLEGRLNGGTSPSIQAMLGTQEWD